MLFVSYDKFNGQDCSVLVVGEEIDGENHYIYNIFYGTKADNIYDLLTTQKLKIINGTGYWKTIAKHSIDGEHPSYDINVCSECNTTSFYPTPYCSHCGAKMEGESDKTEKLCCNCIHNKESELTIENCATCYEQSNFTPKPKGE